jgi:hypothetical protein
MTHLLPIVDGVYMVESEQVRGFAGRSSDTCFVRVIIVRGKSRF